MKLVVGKAARAREVPLDRLTNQFTGRAVLVLGSRLYFGKQTTRNDDVGRRRGFHVIQHSRPIPKVKESNVFNAVDENRDKDTRPYSADSRALVYRECCFS